MPESSVHFRDNEQFNKVFNLFCLVLNDKISLEEISVESLKENYDMEEIALFFELMSKHLNSKIYKKEDSKQK